MKTFIISCLIGVIWFGWIVGLFHFLENGKHRWSAIVYGLITTFLFFGIIVIFGFN